MTWTKILKIFWHLLLFIVFPVHCRVPDQYLCYLNDTKYPTAKFDPEKDQAGAIGWSCINSDDRECIPRRFICDKRNDCSYGSDEQRGCDLYPETNCSSWFEQKHVRKCSNNDRCFNIYSFLPSRDCNDSVWSECHRLDYWIKLYPTVDELFHCNSGDCVPKTNVCDGIDNCKDGSDETEGCKLIPDYSVPYAILAILILLLLAFLLLCFLLFCCEIFTNAMCDPCQVNLQNNISNLQNNVDWAKNTTHIRLFGKWRIPTNITESIKLYELKSLVYRQGWIFINSKMRIRTISNKDSPNLERQGLLSESDFKFHHNYPDGCVTLKSENELFSEVIHDVGMKNLTLGMSLPPKILSKNRSLNGLWSELKTNTMKPPFKVSYVLDMSGNNLYLGYVRDKDHQTVYSQKKYCHADKGEYLKISDTGKLEIYNNEHKKQRMATNFKGSHFKNNINVVVIGQSHSGKSTLAGRLLHDCNEVSENEMDKIKKEMQDEGKSCSPYSWIMDDSKRERELGHSIFLSFGILETIRSSVTLIDTPGHSHKEKDHMKNMIMGVSLADCAVLVVSAFEDEFERGINNHQITLEHATIAHEIGLENIIVVVNKMDVTVPKYSEDRFKVIKDKVMELLISIGYKQSNVYIIPTSGVDGDNLIEDSKNLSWLTEKLFSSNNCLNSVTTLINAIDAIEIDPKPISAPLRVVICNVFDTNKDKKAHKSGAKVYGRIQYGIIKKGMQIIIAPTNKTAAIKLIKKNQLEVDVATAGDMVTLQISDVLPTDILPGHIISDANNTPAKQCRSFTSQITFTDKRKYSNDINEGFKVLVHCHAVYFSCTIQKIYKKIDVNTGETIDDNPKSIKGEETVIVEMVPIEEKAICIEIFNEFPSLSRFVIRKSNKLIGHGKVTHIQ